ncbi:tetratricopeptide repeat protein [Candidatus Poribacteria bacterium]|nr:tetratricopeptide repeat protein [Candidatus Poribacteria bacterium]
MSKRRRRVSDIRVSSQGSAGVDEVTARGNRAVRAGFDWSWTRDGVLMAALLVLSILIFANSLGNGWVYDDIGMIEKNQRLKTPYDAAVFFKTSYWDTVEGTGLYRPLTVWSFALEQAWFGPGPLATHAINVLLNGLIAAGLYAVLVLVLANRPFAFLASLLFAIHPLHTEVVANGVGRAELASLLFAVGAMICHVQYLKLVIPPVPEMDERSTGGLVFGPDWRPPALLLAAMMCYFVSLLFKETTATLPGLLFLLEWLLIQRGSLLRMIPRAGRYFIYAIPLILMIAIRYAAVGLQQPAPQEVMARAAKLQTVLYGSDVLLRQIGQLLYPVWMCAEYSDYTNPVDSGFGEPMVLLSLLAWAGAAALSVWLFRRRHFVLVFGLAWFFLAALPTSNIVIRIGTVRGDRLMFMPSLGYTIIVAWLLVEWAKRQRAAALGAVAVYLVLFAARTIDRNRDWKSTETLWTATIEQNPGSAVGQSFVGDILLEKGQVAEAEQAFRKAVELRESLGFFYREANNRLAGALRSLGRNEEAAAEYRKITEKAPQHYVAYLNLGEILLHDPRTRPQAIEYTRKGISLNPEEFSGYVNLAQALKFDGQIGLAYEAIMQAHTLRPDHPAVQQVKAELEGILAAAKAGATPTPAPAP